MIRSIFLGFLFFILLIPVDIVDIPRFSAEQVLSVAEIFSYECQVESCG
jgi:hypothetical protein